MLEIIDLGSDDVIGMRIDGRIEIADMERVTTVVAERLEKRDKLRIYVELEELKGISLEALWEDMKLGFNNFKHFTHKAVVTDKEWVAKIASFADKIIPGIELKAFSTDERDEALAWIGAPGTATG